MGDIEQVKKEVADRIANRKVEAFDSAMKAQARLERLQRFIKWFREDAYQINELFNDNNPWEVSMDEGQYGNPGITFNLDNSIGCIELDADFRMKMIETIMSRIHRNYNQRTYCSKPATDWRIVNKDEYSLRFRKTVEFEDEKMDIDIYSYGENEICKTVEKKVWKQVTEYEIDCGMEKSNTEEPAPFLGMDGNPV